MRKWTYQLTVTFDRRCGHFAKYSTPKKRLNKIDEREIRRQSRTKCKRCEDGLHNT